MNKRQLNKLEMLRRVNNTLVANASAWQDFSPLFSQQQILDDQLSEIEQLQAEIAGYRSGVNPREKQRSKALLTEQMTMIQKSIMVHASLSGNQALGDKYARLLSELSRSADEMFISKCEELLSEAWPLQEELANYGLADTLLQQAEDQLNATRNLITQPMEKRYLHHARRTRLNNKINEAVALVKSVIDNLVYRYSSSLPEFYEEYQYQRTIIDRRASRTSVATGVSEPPPSAESAASE